MSYRNSVGNDVAAVMRELQGCGPRRQRRGCMRGRASPHKATRHVIRRMTAVVERCDVRNSMNLCVPTNHFFTVLSRVRTDASPWISSCCVRMRTWPCFSMVVSRPSFVSRHSHSMTVVADGLAVGKQKYYIEYSYKLPAMQT